MSHFTSKFHPSPRKEIMRDIPLTDVKKFKHKRQALKMKILRLIMNDDECATRSFCQESHK